MCVSSCKEETQRRSEHHYQSTDFVLLHCSHKKSEVLLKSMQMSGKTVKFLLDERVGKWVSRSPRLSCSLSSFPSLPSLLSFLPACLFLFLSLSLTLFLSLAALSFFGRSDQNKNSNTRHRREKSAMIHRTKGFALS